MSTTEIMSEAKSTKVVEFTKKETMRCLFCGGAQCPKCSETAYLQQSKPAIDKLHSSWITDSILAMQRPSDSILDSGVLESFKTNRITAVFNLTQPGEHPFCGCGNLTTSGFPYSPEKLMEAGIKHFNYSWQDMTTPSISLMTDIVNVACDEIRAGGKIAVHCHAGFGRTGLTIACVMIAKDFMDSSQVIQFIRKRRPGSIQTAAQEKFIQRFERSYYHLMHVFPMVEQTEKTQPSSSMYSKTIAQSIRDQQYVLTAEERKAGTFRHKHKLVHYVVSSLSKLSVEDFNLASLAITGLTKLVLKGARSDSEVLSPSASATALTGTGADSRVMSPNTLSRRPRPSDAKITNLMVASNSLSESAEEPIMNDLKLDINMNNYAKLIGVAEVVASAMSSTPKGATKGLSTTSMSISNMKITSSPAADRASLKVPLAVMNGDISMHLSRDEIEAEEQERADSFKSGPITPMSTFAAIPFPRHARTHSMDSSGDEKDRLSIVPPSDPALSPRDATSPPVRMRDHTDSIIVSSKKPSPKSPFFPSFILPATPQPDSEANSIHSTTSTGSGTLSRSSSAISMLKNRANSLKGNSPNDYAKSKRVSTNLTGQMLLDWLETRKNPLFEGNDFVVLRSLWANFRAEAEVTTPFVKDIAPERRDAVQAASERLFGGIKCYVEEALDRFKLELLGDIIVMLKQFRVIGKIVHGGDVAPIDCLVCLRLAIACIHGKKQYFGLVKNRALNMDLVKMFLLKSTHMDRVIINNITFSVEHCEVIRNNIGGELLDNLEMVLNTFEVLVEWSWHYEQARLSVVHWDELRLPKSASNR